MEIVIIKTELNNKFFFLKLIPSATALMVERGQGID
jgi:hypothetical protein